MAGRIFYISEVNGDTSFQNEQITILSGENLILCLEFDTYSQLLDTIQSNWVPIYLKKIDEISGVLSKYKNIKNVALVHHGSTYSSHLAGVQDKIVISDDWFTKYLPNVYNDLTEEEKKIEYEKQLDRLIEISKQKYTGGLDKKYFIAYIQLKNLISAISDGGNYFSVACDEADTDASIEALGNFTTKKIKVYANTKFTTVAYSMWYQYGSKKISGLGSILNIPLTSNWDNNTGWRYYDTASKKVITTNRDLILKSEKEPYKLIERSFKKIPEGYSYIIFYYSKKFKKWYIENWKKEAYESWKKDIKSTYTKYFHN